MRASPLDRGHLKLLGEHRRGETFVVACHELVDFLSHGTLLEDCRIEIRGSARGIVLHGATLLHSTIHTTRELRNFRWHDVVLDHCTFQGRFPGNDFGRRADAYPDPPFGSVVGCDFSRARLHLCRFFSCDLAGMDLPPWPCVTLENLGARRDEWLALPLPSALRIAQETLADTMPGEVATVIDVEAWCRRTGVDPAELRPVLAPFVRGSV
jgi:hypothetical protein